MQRFAFVALTICALCAALLGSDSARAELKPIIPFAASGAAADTGSAAAAPPSAFGAPPSALGAPTAAPLQAPGFTGRFFAWLVDTQQSLQRELAVSVKELKTKNAFAAAMGLAAISFLYGVLHAVGPGHGKTIISSYVVANEQTARRGIIISFVAAAVQAMTAIVLVGVLALVLHAPGIKINQWSNQLESASYALIALVGFWLLVTQLNGVWRRWRQRHAAAATVAAPMPFTGLAFAHAHAHGGEHDHALDHDHVHAGHDHRGCGVHAHASHAQHHSHAQHDHDHEHGAHCDHMVDPQALAGPLSIRKVAAVVFSVGIRPCTGAILVLIFALTQGVFWAGVAATFAMAIGTAITVAALAVTALGSRELALKLGGRSGAFAQGVWTACALGGSVLIMLFGATLFAVSLGPARPF